MNKNSIKKIDLIAKSLTKAFLKNQYIKPIPIKFTKNISEANKLRVLCESKIKKPFIGFKAGGTGIPMLKKLKEKEPFYAKVFKHNLLKNNKNVKKFISHLAPCIEIVGYRQKKTSIKYLGDLCSDFGANIKFILGPKIKFKNKKINNLKTYLSNYKINHFVTGNTNTVYINPLNSLIFVLNKIKKDKVIFNKNFYIFTGSTVGVVPILGKGLYVGKVSSLGTVKVNLT